jgi:thiol:disulfide interchange protein DsbD
LSTAKKKKVNNAGKMKGLLLVIAWLLLLSRFTHAQIYDPVHFTVQWKAVSETEAEIVFTGAILEGWHVYSTDLPAGGPVSTSITVEEISGAELDGKLVATSKEIDVFDNIFDINLRYFEGIAVFVQKVRILSAEYRISGYLKYVVCNDESCLPPARVSFNSGNDTAAVVAKDTLTKASSGDADGKPAVAAKSKPAVVAGDTPAKTSSGDAGGKPAIAAKENDSAAVVTSPENDVPEQDYWQPVAGELNGFGEMTSQKDMSWLYIFVAGFLGGLLALFTPCVWPVVPMTVSFFLKRSKNKKQGVRDAWTYGASIVVIYVTLGLAITALFGASALNALSTNAVFNILFCLLLTVFAASFFGAFELTLPSNWSNAADAGAEKTGGLLSIFLMAFTLSLVSFSCTGPIIGFLLVQVSTSGSVAGPAVGMFGFAVALALPFTLFALFPSWLKSMPRSGGWMNVIKVTLGFIELAFALKFLSVADLAYGWHILDRETFLALWIIIFTMLGFYMMGKIRFPHDDDDNNKTGVGRFFLALLSFAFALYMVPGLWGAPLKAVSAFSPPLQTQDFNLYNNEIRSKFDDYDLGMEYARRTGKPALLDFTGYGCVNCRKMELAVWTDPQVSSIINNDYVLISLYVDDKTRLPLPFKVVENGQEHTLCSVGDKWSYLQRAKFGANAQPFYILLDNRGYPLNKSYSYNENIQEYIEFLKTGLDNYNKQPGLNVNQK